MLEPSPLNPTVADITKSYMKGRVLAAHCGVMDKENEVEQLKLEDPKRFAALREQIEAADPILDRPAWHAMWSSGLTPFGVLDAIVSEALAAKRAVEFIDPARETLEQLIACAFAFNDCTEHIITVDGIMHGGAAKQSLIVRSSALHV